MKSKRTKRKIVAEEKFSNKSFIDTVIEHIKYDDCVFYGSKFERVTWIGCEFKNTSFFADSEFKSCKFLDCSFVGQHTNLGGPTVYLNCDFKNCLFKNIQAWDTIFKNCIFSGIADNIVFYGSSAPDGWTTIFKNIDLSGLEMNFVDFRCDFDLSTTKK